mgnify:CR=1 FL=1
MTENNDILEAVYRIILDRKNHPTEQSYVASLYAKGLDKVLGNQAELMRAARVIPGGMYGHESTALLPAEFPQFFARGAGSRLWDADGNEYIRYVPHSWSGLL